MDGQAGHDQEGVVGPLLRACRLRMGADLDEASQSLNIRRVFLEAIEDGRYRDLPGPAYVSGFVRAYAEYLGVDGEEAVRRVRAETRRGSHPGDLRFPEPVSESASPGGSIVLVGALIAIVAYGLWYVGTSRDGFVADLVAPLPERLATLLPDSFSTPSEPADTPATGGPAELTPGPSRKPAAPVLVPGPDVLVADAARSALPEDRGNRNDVDATVAMSAPSPTAHGGSGLRRDDASSQVAPGRGSDPQAGVTAAPAGASGEVRTTTSVPAGAAQAADGPADGIARVVLTATERSWVEIRDPLGNRILSRIMAPGEDYLVPAQSGLRLTVGNAGGLEIRVNGEPIPALGGPGVVRRNVPLEPDRLQPRSANP